MKYYTKVGDREREFTFERRGRELVAHSDGKSYRLDLSLVGDGTSFSLLVDDRSFDVFVESGEGGANVLIDGEVIKVFVEDEREHIAHSVAAARPSGKRTITSSMPGVVVEVTATTGESVEDGQTLLVLEAMKMQNPIEAEGAGKVVKVHVAAGDTVAAGAPLVDLE